MNISSYLRDKLAGVTLLGSAFSPPSSVYIGLATSVSADGSTFVEVSQSEYSRKQLTFGAPAAGTVYTTLSVSWTVATTAWGTIKHVGIFDGSTPGSNLLYYGDTTDPETIGVGNQMIFGSGNVIVSLG